MSPAERNAWHAALIAVTVAVVTHERPRHPRRAGGGLQGYQCIAHAALGEDGA